MQPERLVVAWDYDGVLNRNTLDGHFIWAEAFERDIGQSLDVFTDHIFGRDFDKILTGRENLKDRVNRWAQAVGYADGPDALLEYWFARDAKPDAEVIALMDRLTARGVRQVIATNNETHRAGYIERSEAGRRVQAMFASGRMGVRKPHADFFYQVTETLGVAAEAMYFIDDNEANVVQARAMGWNAMLFTDETRHGLEAFLPV